jgi:acetyl-CoA synthetase
MATNAPPQDAIVWNPDEATIRRAQLTRFLEFLGKPDFGTLYRSSVDDVAAFTEQLLLFLDIPFDRPYSKVLDLSRGPAWAQWCVEGTLNISKACLDRHPSERVAVIWEGEEGSSRSLTYGELVHQVDGFAEGLRSLGVRPGDAVAIHLPMLPETVVALLACARIGAIAVPLFSGYGPAAIESRVRDVEAKVLITCDGFPRRGTPVMAKQIADEAVSRCPSIQHVIVVPRMDNGASGLLWDDVLSNADAPSEPTSAEDSLLVLYTSGTTGRPKGVLHTHCGFPVKAAQDMCFGMDVGAGTRICWVTDIGWMMGPWLIYGALILGATICIYDGAPDFPNAGRLWDFCARNAVEVLGVSPTLVRTLAVRGNEFVRAHDLHTLRIFGSTGEPWNPDPWWWLFDTVGRRRIPIINYSGGTEVSGGILMGNPLLPVKPCAFAAACPGIAADIVDERGESVAAGTVGELVIRKPWIGMARGFHRDPERYIATYWTRWPEVWAHGDWSMRDTDGHWYILGRSDDTLKIAGKRVGPAEVESILVAHDAVAEAAVVGVPHDLKGECMIAFCVLAPGRIGSIHLAAELRDRVALELGKALRPDALHFVSALPKTRNAKVMRRVIRAAYLDEDAGDVSALENPAAIDGIRRVRKSAS